VTFGHACMQFAGRDVVARKELVGYWKNAMDSQAMPDAIQVRIDHPETAGKGVHFSKDFDPESDCTKNKKWIGKPPPAAENSPISKAKP
jgi:hypothetical protein